MKKIFIQGENGKMGFAISARLEKENGKYFKKKLFDMKTSDLILDFSSIDGNKILLKEIIQNKIKNKAVLIGTTGLSKETIGKWYEISNKNALSVLLAPNTSLGILMALKAAMGMVDSLEALDFDVEIVETHHKFKVDAPSGTAKLLAEGISSASSRLKPQYERMGKRDSNEIGVHSVRGGGVFGEHEIRFISPFEEIKISHRALSRELFASGALILGRWLLQKNPNFFTLSDINISELA